MIRYTESKFNHRKPLYVRLPFKMRSKQYKRGDVFSGKNVTRAVIKRLYSTLHLTHDDIREQEVGNVKIEKTTVDKSSIAHIGGAYFEYKGQKYKGRAAAENAMQQDL